MSEDQQNVRLDKVKIMREKGINPYPERFERSHSLREAAELDEGKAGVKLAGRVMLVRKFGKLTFATIKDVSGTLQVALQKKVLGDESYDNFKKLVDIGDFIGADGSMIVTKTGEKTLDIKKWTFLGKALRDLPEKFHGLTDKELCYRQRHLDLISSPETMNRFKKRTEIVKSIRRFLENDGFMEVDTPVLQTKASGAAATPFQTHHNSLDMDVYLRIAPETYLKRLIGGGFEKVFEFARCFRNEGMDASHLQDFTLLEYYVAYWNFQDNMDFTERLVKNLLLEVCGGSSIDYQGTSIDFSGNWPRVSLRDLLLKDCEIDIDSFPTVEELKKEIANKNIQLDDIENLGRGNLIDKLYKKVSRPKLIKPIFLINHPVELSPLARKNDNNPNIADRFQLVVNGWEVINAYSELVDPTEQRARLIEQAKLKEAGDTDAMVFDEDFINCMEYGMPPISGWGMGVDRFVALLTNQENLRDIIFFPLMKSVG